MLIILTGVLLASCGNRDPKASAGSINIEASADSGRAREAREQGAPAITFEKTTHDFGTITEGEVAEYHFRFKNTGNAELLISSAEASCGCTIPEYSKEPIAPGEEGYIKVKFNSEGRLDKFTKEITVLSNTVPTATELTITGTIKAKPAASEDGSMSH